MKIGVVQSHNLPGIENVKYNRSRNAEAIVRLFEMGAKIVVLPEFSNHQYAMHNREEVHQFSETLNGESVILWSNLASCYDGYVVGGILERDGPRYYNTAVLVGPQGYVGHYRKVHLFDWEKGYLSEGNLGFPVFQLDDLNLTAGMLICYDLRFPEAVRSLMLAGCDVLLVPTTWTSIGKSVLWDERGYCLANYLAIAHAYSNKMAVVCADRVGQEGEVKYLGASIIVNSNAQVVGGPAAKEQADILLADLDPLASRNKRVGTRNDLRNDRRPRQYQSLLGDGKR